MPSAFCSLSGVLRGWVKLLNSNFMDCSTQHVHAITTNAWHGSRVQIAQHISILCISKWWTKNRNRWNKAENTCGWTPGHSGLPTKDQVLEVNGEFVNGDDIARKLEAENQEMIIKFRRPEERKVVLEKPGLVWKPGDRNCYLPVMLS